MWDAAEWQSLQNEHECMCKCPNRHLRCSPQHTISERCQSCIWDFVQNHPHRQVRWVMPAFVLVLRVRLHEYKPVITLSIQNCLTVCINYILQLRVHVDPKPLAHWARPIHANTEMQIAIVELNIGPRLLTIKVVDNTWPS
jgi:hypothetical protein